MKRLQLKKKTVGELALLFALMLLMSSSLVYQFVEALDLGISVAMVLLFNLVYLGLFAVALRRGRNLLVFSIAAAVFICVFLLLYLQHDSAGMYSPFHDRVNDLLSWAGAYLSGYRMDNLANKRIMAAMIGGLICLTVSLFTVRRLSVAAAVLCGAACFAALFIIGHVIFMPSLFGYILAAMLYFMLHNYRAREPEASCGGDAGLAAFAASALPLAAVVLALTMVLSAAVEINPGWMKDTRDRLVKKSQPVNDTISKGSGSFVMSSDALGGNLYLNDDVVMVVASPVGNVYLRAQSKDEYTGHSWERTDTDAVSFSAAQDTLADTREFEDAAPILAGGGSVIDRLFPSYELTVDYAGSNLSVLYAPLKTSSLTVPGGSILVGADELMPAQGSGNGLSYSLRFCQPQYGDAEFEALACKSSASFYRNAAVEGGSDAAIARRYQGEQQALGEYLQLPEELPEEVRQLAQSVVQGASNDYGRALAIELFLSQNYSYTLTPGSVDKSKDFVDQFLFAGKRGYCTYYASAMAVMLRCVGIPSRYVEGYVLPERDPNTGLFSVTKRQGHAWVEAYFQGLGWLQFEPTKTFTAAPQQQVTPARSSPEPSASSAPASHTAAGIPSTPPSQPASAQRVKMPVLPFLLLAGALALALLVMAAHRVNARLRTMEPRGAVLLVYAQLLKLLEAQGLSMRNGETVREFSERVDGSFESAGIKFGKATEIFQLARYSEHEIAADQKDLMLIFRQTILSASRGKLGWAQRICRLLLWNI